jgi:glucose-6-phosphate dehydrogenase assembly protein OpcA
VSEVTWYERGVNPEQITTELRQTLHNLHVEDETLVPARVLNLVVVVDREWKGEIVNRLERIGYFHPSRTIVCGVQEGQRTIDARVVMRSETTSGGIGVLHERVELDIGAEHLSRLDTIIDPLLVSEIPTVLWSPHSIDQAVEVLLPLVDVILIDSDEPSFFDGAWAGLRRAQELCETVYVVDLAWLRTTPWRERLAAAFDDADRRAELAQIRGFAVRHNPESIVSALLLTGWLSSRLGWTPEALLIAPSGAMRGAAGGAASQRIELGFEPVNLAVRGIAGVTVASGSGFSLSLDRAAGGMVAREMKPATGLREWRILGASRGEGGILGEGVRQALLRDPTYLPSLAAARSFEP